MANKRVAIFSIYYHNWNMGALLQSYALNRCINKLGYDAEHIRFCYAEPAENSTVMRKRLRTVLTRHRLSAEFIESFYSLVNHQAKNMKNFRKFHNEYISSSIGCCDAITAKKLNRKYDVFVTGSDQVWNPEFWSNRLLSTFGLEFADRGKRTVSYAASIGSEQAAIGKEEVYRSILNGLDCISVREEAARKYLQPLTEKPVRVVLDPTLLMTKEEWSIISAKKQSDKPYAFAYFLKEEEPHTAQLHSIASQCNLPIFCISTENRYIREGADRQICDAGPREFVGFISNADVVVTNSFHGMVFSIIFNKPFWVVKRYKDTDKDSANNRITDLLKELGLEDRLFEDGEVPDADKLNCKIDYERVNAVIQEKRTDAIEWLQKALE